MPRIEQAPLQGEDFNTPDRDAPGQTESPLWSRAIHTLAALKRPSASEGEHRAAEWIASWLKDCGCEVTVEREAAHGTYWWPLGLANALAILGGWVVMRRNGPRSRWFGAIAGGTGAAAIWDDVGGGRLWFRRALLPHRSTWNVVAAAGDRNAKRTLVFVAHHDAAHSGLVFHPALGRIPPRLFPKLHERSGQSLPILYGVWSGPALVCAGAMMRNRSVVRTGLAVAAGALAAMADIGASDVVPGANDNLSAVGVLIALAELLAADPIEGLRVLLVSTGSEESFMEGMQGFARRHFAQLDRDLTEIICLECLGGPTLMVLEGEGMLRMRDYSAHMREALLDAAAAADVEISRGLRTVAATDALIALRRGYPAATLASVDYTKLPLNYHWPTDTPQALHWQTIRDAIAVCTALLRARVRKASLSDGGKRS